jgi:hypothetical protein
LIRLYRRDGGQGSEIRDQEQQGTQFELEH